MSHKTFMEQETLPKENAVVNKNLEIPRVGYFNSAEEAPAIAARNLSFWYKKVIAINDISIDIGRGVIGLLGPNGAGKSTFLKLLSGQLYPKTGTLEVKQKNYSKSPELFSMIGIAPEQDAFYEEMTCRQFVTYLTQLQGFSLKEAERLADEAIERVSMEKGRDLPLLQCSKGMRQRIKIAQAIAHNPTILFFDEPLMGTDPIQRRELINLIRTFGEEGRTVIVSSHILSEIEHMTHSIMLIHRNTLIAEGNVRHIRNLLSEYPQIIRVHVDRPKEFSSHLIDNEAISGVQFLNDAMFIESSAPDKVFTIIPKIALEHNFHLTSFSLTDNNLQAVFDYLVNRDPKRNPQ